MTGLLLLIAVATQLFDRPRDSFVTACKNALVTFPGAKERYRFLVNKVLTCGVAASLFGKLGLFYHGAAWKGGTRSGSPKYCTLFQKALLAYSSHPYVCCVVAPSSPPLPSTTYPHDSECRPMVVGYSDGEGGSACIRFAVWAAGRSEPLAA